MRNISRASAALIVVTLITAWPLRAAADTIFSQPIVVGGGSFTSDTEAPQFEADNFSLATADSVLSLKWWGVYSPGGPPSDFAIRFFADAAGSPAIAPFSTQNVSNVAGTDTGLTVGSLPIYEHSANLSLPVALAASTTYYLSIVNLTAGDVFDWATINNNQPHWFRQVETDPWFQSSDDFGFELYDAPLNGQPPPVPTPTAAAGGLALMFMLIGKRRRQESF